MLLSGGCRLALLGEHKEALKRCAMLNNQTATPSLKAGMHSGAAGTSPAAAAVFAASLDKKLRLLEETTSGSGLAVTTEVDAGTVITQLVAPGPGGA